MKKNKNLFLIFMALSAGTLLFTQVALGRVEWDIWSKGLLTLAHIPFTSLAAAYGWKMLKGLDELQRLIHLQAFVFAITAAAIYLLTSNLMSAAGIGAGPRTWEIWPMLWIFYFIRYRGVSKTYRD